MSSSLKGKKSPFDAATKVATTETADDKAIPKSYSLPRSFHERLTRLAAEETAATGKRVSASKILLDAAIKGLEK